MTEPRAPTDTIVAIATPPGRGGVGIVRLSGPKALAIGAALCGGAASGGALDDGGVDGEVADGDTLPGGAASGKALPGEASSGEDAPSNPLPLRRAVFTTFMEPSRDTPLDEGIALAFAAPNSFTGEDVVELHAHGSPVVLDLLLQACCKLGARLARPGEFSERAFLNDKIDLAQAEAVADLIASTTHSGARGAARSLRGAFSKAVGELVSAVVALRTYVEAAIDFPEEEIDFLQEGDVAAKLDGLLDTLGNVIQAARQGSLIQQGMKLVIAGRPNAGKSSLLNALSGQDSAIVTPSAGTTRDVLREQIQIDGLPLHIVDTAGLRDSEDVIEQEGVRRARQEMATADRILLVVDGSGGEEGIGAVEIAGLFQVPGSTQGSALGAGLEPTAGTHSGNHTKAPQVPLSDEAETPLPPPPPNETLSQCSSDHSKIRADSPSGFDESIAAIPITIIRNKCDLSGEPPGVSEQEGCPVVTLSAKTGAGIDLLRQHLTGIMGYEANTEPPFLARRRHLDALERARVCLEQAKAQLTNHNAGELVAEDLRHCHECLGEITGAMSSDDLLGHIFSSFCVGK